ncbi:hypothetical protein JCM15519_18610 [Fundidesulfovibrio butyratiphilus]
MRKSLFVLLASAALLCAFGLTSLWAVEPPKDMVIQAPAGLTATKSPVKFAHAGPGHKALDCKTCHHNWDGKSDKGLKCSDKGCHDNIDMTKKAEVNNFYSAFHKGTSPNSCLGCHRKAKAEGKNAPIACNACHPVKQ